ncbi:MAG: adenosine kinase, partial [Pseudomonadota bacterium]
MKQPQYDVIGLGNAIVDVISRQDDAFLEKWGIHKDAMNLVEEDRANDLTRASIDALETSGGSGANTIAGLASFGARTAFMGKVASDRLGHVFRDQTTGAGVAFSTAPLEDGPATARSIIFVTPDSKRSMNTFLGASVEFSPTDVDGDLIADSAILYLEGYLFDKDAAKAAFVKAAEAAHHAGRKVALTLSDEFCVDRHRDSFRQLVRTQVDILFANEAELLSLYETDDFDGALTALRSETALAAITRGENGSVVLGEGEPIYVAAEPVSAVVDTTGAGDQYAAGFLFGVARGLPLSLCAKLGHIAAAEVISHYGPRPEVSLAGLADQAGITA